ncbi:hypothetical protein IFM89_032521 [Coptis chinensis]|uniref:Oberon PHD finger domain-containing protein n=1 Tax=Coptis chinensis TaxID=261450 RepID=A0A835IUQ6_9MAGN|nr:hypothetical protein IFM89_032521 [Coptis chinensis]
MEDQSHRHEILDGSSGSVAGLKENGLVLKPVPDNASGEGLPYAPIDWPNPGDVWGWRVGRRKNTAGFMVDRYLYPPRRIQKSLTGRKQFFASLQSIREFVKKEFPNANHDAFFASFSWKVPSKDHREGKDLYKEIAPELSGSESDIGMTCKAQNRMCNPDLEARSNSLLAMDCDICCSESGFCRDCCCILCSRSIDWAYGGYSFIRCSENVGENYICGHAAHIDCALRSYMAGTVGGSIGLDVEYYCRRCDQRTDLFSHVSRILKTCESLDSRHDIEKVLKLGLCIVHGSERERAKRLRNHFELALTKLNSGIHLKDIWNVEDDTSAISAGAMRLGNKGTMSLEDKHGQSLNLINSQLTSHQPVYITSDHQIESAKLKEQIEQVLQDLRRSQEFEYRMAEQKLNAQKDSIIRLYQQLDTDRSELAKRTSSTSDADVDALLNNILSRVNQIKEEVVKLKDMEEVAKGFGRTPKRVLKEHFGFHADD